MDISVIYGVRDHDISIGWYEEDENNFDEVYDYLINKYDFSVLWESTGEPKGISVICGQRHSRYPEDIEVGLEVLKSKWMNFIKDDFVTVKIGAIPKLYLGTC